MDGQVEVKVRSLRHPDVRREYQRIRRRYGRAMDRGTLSDKKERELHARLAAFHILSDWRGLTDGGKKIKFTPEKARNFLELSQDFLDDVIQAAGEPVYEHEEDAEAAEKLGKG